MGGVLAQIKQGARLRKTDNAGVLDGARPAQSASRAASLPPLVAEIQNAKLTNTNSMFKSVSLEDGMRRSCVCVCVIV
jgi:hypothetical protein